MEKLFEQILDKDEKIIKVFKPNKAKLYFSSVFASFLSLIWIFIPLFFAVLSSTENQDASKRFLFSMFVLLGYAFAMFIIWIFTRIYYKKLYFAYSNKRIIIRTGIIGTDYKSLDMGMIGAVNVYVSLIDKILCKNTGTISFGSTASPMVNTSGAMSAYRFSHVIDPYALYREVKFVIDEYKESKIVK